MSSIVEYSDYKAEEESSGGTSEVDFNTKTYSVDHMSTTIEVANLNVPEVGDDVEINSILMAAVYPYRNVIKTIFDKIVALLLLIFLLPLMLIIGLIVRRDGGPAIFAHRRIGLNGKPFYCLKYRTMVTDSERVLAEILSSNAAARNEWNLNHKLRHDARVTKIGAFLRRSSLDELPQLINVLRGEMSLVGPRPITSEEVPKYGELINYYFLCRPGITGLWQVSGRNDVSYNRRIRMDAFYARKLSFRLDLGILILTMRSVVLGEGAS
jgi:exopolysaccharide production protein ExoY